jgi:hypothetical protein
MRSNSVVVPEFPVHLEFGVVVHGPGLYLEHCHLDFFPGTVPPNVGGLKPPSEKPG